jgi:hypothetical protein
MGGFVGRLIDLLVVTEYRPIVFFLDESMAALCFLYMLGRMVEMSRMAGRVLHSLLKVVMPCSQQLELLLRRTALLNREKVEELRAKKGQSVEAAILERLDGLSRGSEQSCFVVVGGSWELRAVLELLNRRTNLAGSNGLTSWLLCPFFSSKELTSIFRSRSFIDFIDC